MVNELYLSPLTMGELLWTVFVSKSTPNRALIDLISMSLDSEFSDLMESRFEVSESNLEKISDLHG